MRIRGRSLAVAVLAGLILVVAIWRLRPRRRCEGMTDQQKNAATQVATAAPASAAAPAIFKGSPADHKRYPWYVSLYTGQAPDKLFMACGGALVTPQHVLSAAHCTNPTWARVGGGTWIKVKAVQNRGKGVHPANDWMLVHLATPAPQTPIKLAAKMPVHQATITIVGRGNKATGNEDRSFTRATMSYIDNPVAVKMIGGQWGQRLQDKNAGFAASAVSGPCPGDSGSPVFVEKALGQDELIGVISIGNCEGGHLYFCKVAGRFKRSGNGLINQFNANG